MSKKTSCDTTSYTGGFKITVKPDGTFVATKGETTLKAANAEEINALIKKFNQTNPSNENAEKGCCP
ncbi:MAG: hypothetical protein ACQCN3_04265 [Candidatus Bathyarchaeia archaeon]|jgi:hypothetical protein